MKARKSLFYSLCLYSALVQSTLAAATTYHWAGVNGGSWTNPAHWLPPGFPKLAGDNAIFSVGATGTPINVDMAGLSVGSIELFLSFTITGNPLFVDNTGFGSSTNLKSLPVVAKTPTISSNLVLNQPCFVTVGVHANPFTISGVISSPSLASPILIVQGSGGTGGTLVLSGNNTYQSGTSIDVNATLSVSNDNNLGNASGGIIFTGGTLEITAGSFSSNRGITLSPAGIIQADASPVLLSGNIIGPGGTLTKTGTGTVTLSGVANTYSGGTNFNGGTLAVSTDGNLGNAAGPLTFSGGALEITTTPFSSARTISIATTGSFIVDGLDTATLSGPIGGSGSLTKSGTAELLLTNNSNSYSGGTIINSGTFSVGSGGILNPSGSVSVNSATSTFDITALTATSLTIGDLLGVPNSFAINLSGKNLTFGTTGNTLFAGDIIGPGGSITKQNSGTVTLAGVNTYDNGTNFNGGTLSVSADNNLGNAAGLLTFLGGTLETTANFTSSRPITITSTGTFNVDPGVVTTLTGNIIGVGGSLTKIGTGTLVLEGTGNNYSGGTFINAGTLSVSLGGTLNPSGSVMMVTNATFDISGSTTLGVVINDLSGAVNSFVTLGSQELIFGSTGTATFGGVISGSGSIRKKASGTAILEGMNTFTGGTTIAAGTLSLSLGGSLSPSGFVNVNSATSVFDISSHSLPGTTIGDLIGVAGSMVTLGSNNLTFGTTTPNTTFAGVISGAGGSITKQNSGTVTLTGVNTYDNGTNFNGGTVSVGMDVNLGNTSGLLTFLGGTLETTASFNSSRPITINSTGTFNVDSLVQTVLTGNIMGGGSLTKIGMGTLFLEGSGNNYAGGTFINTGILSVANTGNLNPLGFVSVASGATFDISALAPSGLTIGDLIGVTGSFVTLVSKNLTFGTNNPTPKTFAGVISGPTGSITKQNSGTETLTGVNTYQGDTHITGGTLSLSLGGSISSSATVIVDSGATFDITGSTSLGVIINDLSGAPNSSVTLGSQELIFGSTGTATFAGVISGSGGSIRKKASGIAILEGINTFTGGTTIAAGTLSLSLGGSLASSAFVNLTGSPSAFDITGISAASTTIEDLIGIAGSQVLLGSKNLTFGTTTPTTTFAGIITGPSGSITKQNSGTVILTGVNTYQSDTNITGGTLSLSLGGSISSSDAVIVAAGATFDITNSTLPNVVINNLSGAAGSFVTLGSNQLRFGSTGSPATFAGVISGLGNILKKASGTAILTGANTYSGGTTVALGTLQGNATSLQGPILDNANLVFDQTGAGTYAGSITGSGTLVTQGSGSLNFTGASNLPGLVTVASGTLFINGSLAGGGPMTVSPGATLGGTGTITKDITINGTLAPGNSIGTINLVGAQTLAPGSTTAIELNPTTNDLVNVTGTMMIDMGTTLQLIPLPGMYSAMPMTRTIIQTTGGVNGTFSTVTTTIPLFLGTVTYTTDDVLLTITPVISPTVISGLTGNNLIFANYINKNAPNLIPFFLFSFLDGTFNAALASAAPTRNAFSLFAADNNMFYLDTLLSNHNRNARNARRQAYIPAQRRNTAQAESVFDIPANELITEASELLDSGDPTPMYTQVDSSVPCEVPEERPFEIWVETFGALAYQKKQSQTPAFNPTTGGLILGFDGKVSDRARVGTGAAYTFTYIHEKQDAGHSRISQEYLFIYTTWDNRHWYFDTALVGGIFQIHNVRDIHLTGFDFKSQSKPRGGQLAPHLEVGYDYNFYDNKFTAEPFVMFDWVNNWQKSYHETGSGPFNAGQKSHYSSFLRSELGLRFYETIRYDSWNFTVQEKLSYLNKKPFKVGRVNAFLVGAPGSFTVETLTDTQNLAVAELELVFQPHNGSFPRTTLEYQGEFGVMYRSHLVSLELTWDF